MEEGSYKRKCVGSKVISHRFIQEMNGDRVTSNVSSIRLPHSTSVGDFVPDKKPTYQPGHVENLTPDQDYVLKEVWCFLLKEMGYHVNLPQKLKSSDSGIHRTTTVSSSHTTKSSFGHHKKSRFGKLGKKKSHDNVEQITDQISKLSTDPGITLLEQRLVTAILRDYKPEQVQNSFFNFLRHDTPDNLLLRFVRARKFKAGDALKMVSETIKWRVEEAKADELLRDNELGCASNRGIMKSFEDGKLFFRGFDKAGRPLVIVRPRFHHSSAQSEKDTETFTLLVIEYARLLLNEPVDSLTIIFDLTGFSLSNMDYAPVKFMIKVFEAHYPESLGVLLIHKAPWVFGGIWSVVKNWLDPVVASKINFTRNTKDLNNFISPENLIKDLGGLDNYSYKYVAPSKKDMRLPKDENYEDLLQERNELTTAFIEATILWIESTSTKDNDLYRKEKILTGRELANNYIKIHPYLVNKSFYHKIGAVDLQPFDIFYDAN